MKKAIAIFLVLTFCSMLLAGCSDAPADGSIAGGTSILNIGTGSVGGTDNTVVEAISSVVNQKTGLKTSTITTNGGTEIIYLLETGDIQAGYSGTIDLINALNGASSFDHAVDPSHMLQCFGFVTWDLPLVVLDNSGIENYEDLAGKRVGLSPVGSSTAEVLMLVLEAYDLTDSVTIENFTWNEGYTALKDGRIDAMVGSWANGDPISGLIELKATKDIRILNMSEEAAQAVAQAGRQSGVVIATGGGAPLSAENRASLRQNGRIYYIERDLAALAREGRPLSSGAQALENMYAARLPVYRALCDREVRNTRSAAACAAEIEGDFCENTGD